MPSERRVPAHQQTKVESGEFTDLTPTEYRADVVVVLSTADSPVLAVVVEAQPGRDRGKRWSWPVYLATLRARLRCPAMLLVVCVETATATWCAAPIELGHPGWTLAPLVRGPERVPVVTDADEAVRVPELAVLSAMAHGADPGRRKVLDALLQGRAEGRDEGRAEATATAVIAVLDARGVDVPDNVRTRITECSDVSQLDTWVRRAATANSISDLFDESGR